MSAATAVDDSVTLRDCVQQLRARRAAVGAELNAFPRPIAACDVDFAVLLQEQAALATALAALEPIVAGKATVAHPRGA